MTMGTMGTGNILQPNQTPPLPGTYLTIRSGGLPPNLVRGVFGLVGTASWGPLNTPVTGLASPGGVQQVFGSGGNIAGLAQEAFNGGAQKGAIVRAGTGGTPGTLVLKDTTAVTPLTALTLPLKYAGTRALTGTFRPVLGDSTQNEFVIYEGSQELETTRIPSTGDQKALLAAALATSAYVGTPTVNNSANTHLATVTQSPFTGGADPTVDATAFTNALTAIGVVPWYCLILGTEDASIQASAVSFIDGLVLGGFRRVAVVGQPHTVSLATREGYGPTFNSPRFALVVGGVQLGTGTLDGMYAAARLGGFAASMKPTWELTAVAIPDATGLLETYSRDDLINIQAAGAIGFFQTALGRFVTTRGVSTWTNETAIPQWAQSLDAGWAFFDRAVRLDTIVDDLMATFEDILTDPEMDNRPRMTDASIADLIKVGQSVLDGYKPNALQAATLMVDPDHAPANRTIWMQINPFQDVAGADTVVLELTTTTS